MATATLVVSESAAPLEDRPPDTTQLRNVLQAVQHDSSALRHALPEFRGDRHVVLTAVRSFGGALEFASPELRRDAAVVSEAVRQNGFAIRFADQELRGNREIALIAVRRFGMALEYCSDALRRDREVVVEASAQSPFALRFAHEALRNDRDLVFAAVQKSGDVLRYAPAFASDRDMVMAAVTRTGSALAYASRELKEDREVVLAALASSGMALRHVPMPLRVDPEVALRAVRQDKQAWQVIAAHEVDLPPGFFAAATSAIAVPGTAAPVYTLQPVERSTRMATFMKVVATSMAGDSQTLELPEHATLGEVAAELARRHGSRDVHISVDSSDAPRAVPLWQFDVPLLAFLGVSAESLQ